MVASNRRWIGPDGKPQFGRGSYVSDEKAREAPEGTIDPFLKTISFWNDKRPVAALSCYATHPMSIYGRGLVSSDFVGLARARRQSDDHSIFQMYASGCSGNVTAGEKENRRTRPPAPIHHSPYPRVLPALEAAKTCTLQISDLFCPS